MTNPRYMPPGDGVHLIRNAERGRCTFAPRRELVAAFLTILARAAKDHEVGICCWSMMSNHIHIYCFDKDPTKPSRIYQFKRFLHSVFARWLNDFWETDDGPIFSAKSVGKMIRVIDVEREIHAVTYIEANPVAGGLVEHPEEHGGATSLRSYLLEPLEIPRPQKWFRKNRWPKVAKIKLEVPPQARREGHDEESWFELTSELLEEKIVAIHEAREEAGLTFRGLEALRKDGPHVELGCDAGYEHVPFTCSDPVRAAAEYMRERRFLRSYRVSWQRKKNGKKNVTFPYGTMKLGNEGEKVRRAPAARRRQPG